MDVCNAQIFPIKSNWGVLGHPLEISSQPKEILSTRTIWKDLKNYEKILSTQKPQELTVVDVCHRLYDIFVTSGLYRIRDSFTFSLIIHFIYFDWQIIQYRAFQNYRPPLVLSKKIYFVFLRNIYLFSIYVR
jgi:hypothetical protein